MAEFISTANPTEAPLKISEEEALKYQGGIPGLAKSGYTQKPVSMLSTDSATKTLNSQKSFMDTTYPQTPAPKTSETPAETPPPKASGKAYFANQAGQEAEYTQEQLASPETQKYLKDNGYALVKSDGVNVGSDFSSSGMKSDLDSASADVEKLTKDFLSYNVDQDPDYQAQANDIRQNFARLKTQTEKTNAQRQRAFETLGFRSGASQYAGGIQMGIEGEELTQANQRLADLTSEEASAISSARLAYKTNKFTEFNAKVNALKDIRDEKRKTLEDYNKTVADATKRLQDEEKNLLENQKSRLEIQKLSQDVITKNLESYASGFIDIDEKGNVQTATPEEIKAFADKTGYSYEEIVGAVRKKAYDLSKMSQEDRLKDLQIKKAEVDALNAGLSSAETEWQNAKNRGEFKGSFLQWVKAKATAERKGEGTGGGTGLDGIFQELDFRTANAVISQADKFGNSDIVKKFNNFVATANLIAGVDPKSKNPAEHQAVIYNFAKALDPDSVVREGEYATVKKYSQSIAKKYKGEINQAVNGTGFLSEDAIRDIQKATKNRIDAYKPQYENLKSEYARKIDNIAGKPIANKVLVEYESGETQAQPAQMTLKDGTIVKLQPDGTYK